MSTKKIKNRIKNHWSDYRNLSPKEEKKKIWQNLKSFKLFQKKDSDKPKKPVKKSFSPKVVRAQKPSLLVAFIKFLGYLAVLPFLIITYPFRKMGEISVSVLAVRQNYLRIIFTVVFLGIIFRFAQLQIIGADSKFFLQSASKANYGELVVARRGQIFIQDQSQNKLNISVTSSQLEVDIFVDVRNFGDLVENGTVDLEETIQEISSRLNLNYSQTLKAIKQELDKENPTSHLRVRENANEEQRNSVLYLREYELNKKYKFQNWLGLTEKQTRSYPYNKFMASIIGYVPPNPVPEIDIKEKLLSCQNMVENNKQRGVDRGEYIVGYYGLEQKYCSELGGINGLRQFGFSVENEEKQVLNGADLYLTIDKNIQERAEQILEETVRNQTNNVGPPKDGTILVVEAKTGKIRAMASWPSFDPNQYQKYWQEKPESFRNVATSVDYDIGSVMKPITVASALNIYQSGFTENGIRKGVPADWTFTDYTAQGKPYTERDGKTFYIQNSEGTSFRAYGNIGLKEVIRDSINTGIADIVDETGARKLKEYFEDRFKLGKPTLVSLPGDGHGNVSKFQEDITCPICYANFGYGQGFTASPLQLVRAYTPIANGGNLVEPYLVEKITYKDGRIDDGTGPESIIRKEQPQPVISQNTAKLVTSYMQAVIDEGYLGQKKSAAAVPGYAVAAKTGTAEVNRPYTKTDSEGRVVLDEKGQPVLVPCDYTCNRLRGRYDQTFIGFGPVRDPKYIVMIKLSEPNPGQVKNFSAVTLAKPFSNMMEFSLNYAGVAKDY